MISDISFIVIARNEAFGVARCLDALAAMPLENCEVICVDSASEDATPQVMLGFYDRIANLSVIRCEGFVNAAVARNVGLSHVTKGLIFFVDGDVALSETFLYAALECIRSGQADAVTGQLHEIQYTPNYGAILRELTRRAHIQQKKTCLMTGGIFLARRTVIAPLGPWDTRLWRLQDFEYTLRMTRKGRLIQLPQCMGTHHTQEYHDRSWDHFLMGYPQLYGHLIRQNLDRPDATWALLRGNRGLASFLLLLGTLGGMGLAAGFGVLPCWSPWAGLFGLITLEAAFSLGVKREKLWNWIRHSYLEPPGVIWGVCRRLRRVRPVSETHSQVILRT